MIVVVASNQETPLDIFLLCVLLVGMIIAIIAVVLSAGDLRVARSERIPDNPSFSAALQGLVMRSLLATVLIGLLGLVLTRFVDRPDTTMALVFSVTWETVAISFGFFIDMYFRRRIDREAEKMMDPCGDCPFLLSPYREKARAARARRGPATHTHVSQKQPKDQE